MGDNFFNSFFGHEGQNSPFNVHFNPGAHTQQSSRDDDNANSNVNNDKLYNILGINKDADNKTIRKAYLKRSTNGEYKHPDKGGDADKFKELSQAYEILKDTEKRKEYDTYGEDIFDNDFEQKKAFKSQFGNVFGFQQTSSGTSSKRPIKKGSPTMFPFNMSLEELCKNTTKRIKITRKVVFEKASDKNNHTPVYISDEQLENVWDSCEQCRGRGMTQRINQIRPGMVQQIQMPCQTCQTTGYKLNTTYEIREHVENN